MQGMMQAGVASETGLRIAEVPIPAPLDKQILVKVRAAGMNRADLNAAKGAGVASTSAHGKPIGMEWAGEIIALGAGVEQFFLGEFVACSGAGGYAEYAVVDQSRAIRFDPEKVTLDQAAVLPLALMTAHNALITEGRMAKGDRVLIHGGSSAVGLAAIKIARQLGAGFVAATSTSGSKRNRLKEFGVDAVIDPASQDWSQAVLDLTGGQGVDVIIDMVTGPALHETMKAAAVRGRVVNVGRLGGLRAEIDLDHHALKRLDFIGVTFRTRSAAEIVEIVHGVHTDLWAAVERGELTLPIDCSFALADAVAAHAHMAANRHFGKIVLNP